MGVELSGSSPEIWQVTFSVPASAPAGTLLNGSITRIIGQPSQLQLTVPTKEMWEIDDFYTGASQTPDANIQPVRNSNVQPYQPNLNSLVITNQNKIKMTKPMILEPGDNFYINAITTSANGTSAVTLVLYVQAVRHSLVNP